MSVVEATDAPSPSSDSVQYLYGTNPAEDGEVITSRIREDPATIEPKEQELLDYKTSEEYLKFWEDESGMPKGPVGDRTDKNAGGRTDGTLTSRGPSSPKNTMESPQVGPSQTSQTIHSPNDENSL